MQGRAFWVEGKARAKSQGQERHNQFVQPPTARCGWKMGALEAGEGLGVAEAGP